MSFNLDIKAERPSTWLTRLCLAGAFLGIALLVPGVASKQEYRWIEVLEVHHIAGEDSWHKAVLVNTVGEPRMLRMTDPHLMPEVGQKICVRKKQMIIRSLQMHRLAHPFYCRKKPADAPFSFNIWPWPF